MPLSSDVLENIKLIDDRTKKIVFGYIHSSLQDTVSTLLYTDQDIETITFQCLIFYHIDTEQTLLFSNIYNMFIDPEYCGHDIELSQWYDSLKHNLHCDMNKFTRNNQKEIFDYMDKDNDGWIHKSDFVIFITSFFYDNKKYQKLQTLLLNSIDTNINNIKYNKQKQNVENSIQNWLKTLEQRCKIVRMGIIPRKEEDLKCFSVSNVMNWVIHQVINWMDNIGMNGYSKYFADFERPMSGRRILNRKNIYHFRLEIDFNINTFDALKIIKEIDNLREYIPKDDKLIDYIEESKWLDISFNLLGEKYRNSNGLNSNNI
eukprot:17272_1